MTDLATLSAAATEPFDWAGLAKAACEAMFEEWTSPHDGPNVRAVEAYLRERIEAAFVPVERHARELFDATAHGELKTLEALARVEAAEARVKVLEDRLRHIANYYPAGHRITELALEALEDEHDK